MKKINTRLMTIATVIVFLFSLSLLAHAQDAAALYKAKCAMCHGADGAKPAGHDLQVDAQKLSDADMAALITDGKPPKMPAYKDKLKPEEITGLVAYIRTLKK